MIKIPKTVLAILAAGLASTALTCQHAQALPMINGAITFSGGATFDTVSLATATEVTMFSNFVVTSRDGDFASSGINVGDPVSTNVSPLTPWVFNPSTPFSGLWSVGGFTYDLLTSHVVYQFNKILFITGTGTISGSGFAPTSGDWSFTTQSPSAGGVFSFSAGTSAVPDGGTTVALLGITLTGIELIRRKLKTA